MTRNPTAKHLFKSRGGLRPLPAPPLIAVLRYIIIASPGTESLTEKCSEASNTGSALTKENHFLRVFPKPYFIEIIPGKKSDHPGELGK